MDGWPQSWAGVKEDEKPGRGLVAELCPFIVHLVELGFTAKAIRRHQDYLWAIGGAIVKQFNDEPALRDKTPRQLLLDAIVSGEAPILNGASETEQRSADTTARKLLNFFRSVLVDSTL
jgi:hypothetical protein